MRGKSFEVYLRGKNLSENTVRAYLGAVRLFMAEFGSFNRKNLLAYREFLIKNYKAQTVNLRIIAVNRYLNFLGKQKLLLKGVKFQKRRFLDDVISLSEYRHLKNFLKTHGKIKWYFLVWFLAATGVRISELLQVKIEDIRRGYADLHCKGAKVRRIYIPFKLRKEILLWFESEGRSAGFAFLNRFGNVISSRGVAMQLKTYAKACGISEKLVHPHSFRHCFAKNFLSRGGDIAFLADLLGHESIETTRIYLCRTSKEQQHFIDSVVNW